jgi:hypothetical protein
VQRSGDPSKSCRYHYPHLLLFPRVGLQLEFGIFDQQLCLIELRAAIVINRLCKQFF